MLQPQKQISTDNVPFKTGQRVAMRRPSISAKGPPIGASDIRDGSAVRRFPRDFCNAGGAAWLAARLKEYWAARGHEVSVELRSGDFSKIMRSNRVDVRSSLRNGWPA